MCYRFVNVREVFKCKSFLFDCPPLAPKVGLVMQEEDLRWLSTWLHKCLGKGDKSRTEDTSRCSGEIRIVEKLLELVNG